MKRINGQEIFFRNLHKFTEKTFYVSSLGEWDSKQQLWCLVFVLLSNSTTTRLGGKEETSVRESLLKPAVPPIKVCRREQCSA